MNLMNEPERIDILKKTIIDYESNKNEDIFVGIKDEIDYFLMSNLSMKEFIIKISDAINNEYFSYPVLIRKIRDKENFTMVRYQDGEWTCMLKIEPHFTNKIPKYGIEIDELGDVMLEIIKSKPEYFISVNAGTFYERAGIVWPYLKSLKNLYVGEVFRRKSVEDGLDEFIETLKSRKVIVVGPKWLEPLSNLFDNTHVICPFGTLFKEEEILKLNKQVKEKIELLKHDNPVILYSCSFPAKLMSHDFYNKYGNSITQIDIGAIWDPYCGKKTRPYHEKVLDRINKK